MQAKISVYAHIESDSLSYWPTALHASCTQGHKKPLLSIYLASPQPGDEALGQAQAWVLEQAALVFIVLLIYAHA